MTGNKYNVVFLTKNVVLPVTIQADTILSVCNLGDTTGLTGQPNVTVTDLYVNNAPADPTAGQANCVYLIPKMTVEFINLGNTTYQFKLVADSNATVIFWTGNTIINVR